MACSLLKSQDDYVGMHQLEIRPLFGNHTGYYYTESVPTYLIEIAKTRAQDSWQIVFLRDRDPKGVRSRRLQELMLTQRPFSTPPDDETRNVARPAGRWNNGLPESLAYRPTASSGQTLSVGFRPLPDSTPYFVFNDPFITMNHEGYLSRF